MHNRFLAKGYSGTGGVGTQIMAIAMTWGGFLLVGTVPFLIPLIVLLFTDRATADAFLENPSSYHLLGLDGILLFSLLMLEFTVGMGALWAGLSLLQDRLLKSVITGMEKIRWGRMIRTMGLWMGMMVAYAIISYLLDPEMFIFHADLSRLWLFLLPVLILTPIQCAFEEMAIRGQLMQALHRLSPRLPYLPLIATALLFALLHGFNNEIGMYGFWIMMLHYLSFGLFLGAFAIMDEGLEMSIGLHTGNNLFSFLFISYPGVAIDTPSVLVQRELLPFQDLLVMWGMVGIVFIVMLGRRKNALGMLLRNTPYPSRS